MCGLIANLIWCYFNPRSPHRERRGEADLLDRMIDISIHAPLTGSDYRSCSYWICSSYFNPRSPHRERLLIHWVMCLVRLFQSTLSSQGATQSGIRSVQIKEISIHAPLTGSDQVVATDGALVRISIHAPLTGSDDRNITDMCKVSQFQSTLPSQGATCFYSPTS